MKLLSLAHQTLFADLVQRCLDAEFDETFPENGSFVRLTGRNGQQFWYYKGYRRKDGDGGGRRYSKYVGPVADPAVTARVEAFHRTKSGYAERRALVRTLLAAGLPAPPGFLGDLIETLGRAGLFRLQGVLVGTAAFQTYAGLLGIRFPGAVIMTGDLDIAQFHAVSVSVGDSLPPVLDELRRLDPSFRDVSSLSDPQQATTYVNARGFRLEFLTPNRVGDSLSGGPARMPALGGAAAQPLRYLDFLIRDPVRSVVLHRGGTAVLVPAPERFAIHKLMLSELRREDRDRFAKSRKDLEQAALLIGALANTGRRPDLGLVAREAMARGPKWRDLLARARLSLAPETETLLAAAILAAEGLA